jgi:hypothetical protein
MKPIVFVGNEEHALVRGTACRRAGIPFHHINIKEIMFGNVSDPNDLSKFINKLNRIRSSVVVVPVRSLVVIVSSFSKHSCIWYNNTDMSEEILGELTRYQCIYSRSNCSNEEFLRLYDLSCEKPFTLDIPRDILELGFFPALLQHTNKDLVLYYHKIWPARHFFVSPNPENTFEFKDLIRISELFTKNRPNKIPHDPLIRGFLATEFALKVLATETKTTYEDLICKLTNTPKKIFKFWQKWKDDSSTLLRYRNETHILHNMHGPAIERSESNNFIENFYLFEHLIETRSNSASHIEKFGSYDDLSKLPESQIAEKILSQLLDEKKYDVFAETYKIASEIVGHDQLSRFSKALRSYNAAKALIEQPI